MLINRLSSVALLVVLFSISCRCEYWNDIVPSNPNKCTLPRVRKAWHEHTDQEKSDFVRTIDAMKQYNGVRPNLYDYFGCVHNVRNGYWHGGSFFLPVHRFFLWKFETALQFIARTVGPTLSPPISNPCLTLPYWAWELDANVGSNNPNKSALFDGGYIGPRPNPQDITFEVRSGAFANWDTPTLLNSKCGDGLCSDPVKYPQYGPANYHLKRWFNSKIVFTHNPVLIMSEITSNSKYETYSAKIEAWPHVNPHLWIAYDMARMTSPFDPIFWMHYVNIDRLWAIWQDCYDYEEVDPENISEPMYKQINPRKEPNTPAGLDDPIIVNHPTFDGPLDGTLPTVRQIYFMGTKKNKGLEDMFYRYGNDFIINNYGVVNGHPACPSNAQGWNLLNYKSSSKRQLTNDAIFSRMLDHTNSTVNIKKIKTLYDTFLQKAKHFNKKGSEGLAFVAKLICDSSPKFQLTDGFIDFIEMNGVPLYSFDNLCGNLSSWCSLPGNSDRPACKLTSNIIIAETQKSTQKRDRTTVPTPTATAAITVVSEDMMIIPKWVFGTVVGLGLLLAVIVVVITVYFSLCSVSKKKMLLPSNMDVL